MSANTELINDLDEFFKSLLKESRASNMEGDGQSDEDGAAPIGFVDRLKLFSEGVKWVAVKNRLSPEDDPDEFGKLAGKYRGAGKRRGRAAPAEAAPAAGGNGAGH